MSAYEREVAATTFYHHASAVCEVRVHPSLSEPSCTCRAGLESMPERRKPEREVEKEHRQLTPHQEAEIQTFVFVWIVPAAILLALVSVVGARC
jgi:hypothetical protein